MSVTRRPLVFAIVAAAGAGVRFGGCVRKPLVKLGRDPILVHTVRRLASVSCIREMLIVVNPQDESLVRRKWLPRLRKYRVSDIVVGGRSRQESVKHGLARVPLSADLVLVHDAVRPLVRKGVILATIRAAQRVGGAILAAPVKATLKRVGPNGLIAGTVPREDLWSAQTPQVFRRSLLAAAYEKAERRAFRVTDDAGLLERLGHPVAVVEGSEENIKITTREDLTIAKALLAAQGNS